MDIPTDNYLDNKVVRIYIYGVEIDAKNEAIAKSIKNVANACGQDCEYLILDKKVDYATPPFDAMGRPVVGHNCFVLPRQFTKCEAEPSVEERLSQVRRQSMEHYLHIIRERRMCLMFRHYQHNVESWPHGISLNDMAYFYAARGSSFDDEPFRCLYCMSVGAPRELVFSHRERDYNGVTCPNLYNSVCSKCGCTGNFAHRSEECPWIA